MTTPMNNLDWAGWILVGMAVRDQWHEIEWPFTKITLMNPAMADGNRINVAKWESLEDLMRRSPDEIAPAKVTVDQVELGQLRIRDHLIKVGYHHDTNQLFISEPEEIR